MQRRRWQQHLAAMKRSGQAAAGTCSSAGAITSPLPPTLGFSRLDPLDPVVSMGANIFPIVLPVFEMAPKKPEDRH